MQIILHRKGRKGLGLFFLQSHLFWVHKPMQNNDEAHQMFIEDLVLYICKRYHALFITKKMAKKVGFTLMSSSFISFPYYAYG
jgi:hypothetical protein